MRHDSRSSFCFLKRANSLAIIRVEDWCCPAHFRLFRQLRSKRTGLQDRKHHWWADGFRTSRHVLQQQSWGGAAEWRLWISQSTSFHANCLCWAEALFLHNGMMWNMYHWYPLIGSGQRYHLVLLEACRVLLGRFFRASSNMLSCNGTLWNVCAGERTKKT